jgi:hypothetical protein
VVVVVGERGGDEKRERRGKRSARKMRANAASTRTWEGSLTMSLIAPAAIPASSSGVRKPAFTASAPA